MASKSNWSVLVDVEINTSDLNKKLKEAAKGTTFKVDTKDAEKSLDKINDKGKELGLTYQEANLIMQRSLDIISRMADAVTGLDASLIEFQKVSDLSGKALEKYTQRLGDSGAIVARTTTEMVDAATTFRKSGFNDQDAATLALIASMFQNVADGQVEASEAASSIISQLKAFNIEASNASRIIDVYNHTANNFAVTTTDISKAMEVGGAGLAVYGNSFEQAVSLVTSGSEISALSLNSLN